MRLATAVWSSTHALPWMSAATLSRDNMLYLRFLVGQHRLHRHPCHSKQKIVLFIAKFEGGGGRNRFKGESSLLLLYGKNLLEVS